MPGCLKLNYKLTKFKSKPTRIFVPARDTAGLPLATRTRRLSLRSTLLVLCARGSPHRYSTPQLVASQTATVELRNRSSKSRRGNCPFSQCGIRLRKSMCAPWCLVVQGWTMRPRRLYIKCRCIRAIQACSEAFVKAIDQFDANLVHRTVLLNVRLSPTQSDSSAASPRTLYSLRAELFSRQTLMAVHGFLPYKSASSLMLPGFVMVS
jgi:hypothetical protein